MMDPMVELNSMWMRQLLNLRDEIRRISRMLMEARDLLKTHQWGGSGHCPECAMSSHDGHRDDCKWKRAMEGEL